MRTDKGGLHGPTRLALCGKSIEEQQVPLYNRKTKSNGLKSTVWEADAFHSIRISYGVDSGKL